MPAALRSSALNTTVCGGNGQSDGNPFGYGFAASFASAWQVVRSAAFERPCSTSFFVWDSASAPPHAATSEDCHGQELRRGADPPGHRRIAR